MFLKICTFCRCFRMLYNLNLLDKISIIASCESPQEPYDISRFIEALRSGFTELEGRLHTIHGQLSSVDCIFPDYQPEWSFEFQQCKQEFESVKRQDIVLETEVKRGNFGMVLKGT